MGNFDDNRFLDDQSDEMRYSEITPQLMHLSRMSEESGQIDPELYEKLDVKRGLRDLDGKGVLAGLTEISTITAKKMVDGKEVPDVGRLYYRGISIDKLVSGFTEQNRYGFEEITYLILFGKLPTKAQLRDFSELLYAYRASLPQNFVRDIIMAAPGSDMMNMLARGVLTLYSFDPQADDVSLPNVLRQCLQLIAMFPLISVYGYNTYQHYFNGRSLLIRQPKAELSYAENILYMLRRDGVFSHLEAELLDLCLVLHMEHGGGNNSTFTTHVVSSSGTDTYSSFAASLGSLKGPRHGGANIKVVQMMDDLKAHVRDWESEEEVGAYLRALLDKEAFDHSGLIYGIGHAIYSVSDPRAQILEKYAKMLSEEKRLEEEMALYHLVEELAPKIIAERSKMYKGVSANVDFFSGFVYRMLDLPIELYTPIFAIARSVGWSAHRLEELTTRGKIIRPAYMAVGKEQDYTPLEKR